MLDYGTLPLFDFVVALKIVWMCSAHPSIPPGEVETVIAIEVMVMHVMID